MELAVHDTDEVYASSIDFVWVPCRVVARDRLIDGGASTFDSCPSGHVNGLTSFVRNDALSQIKATSMQLSEDCWQRIRII